MSVPCYEDLAIILHHAPPSREQQRLSDHCSCSLWIGGNSSQHEHHFTSQSPLSVTIIANLFLYKYTINPWLAAFAVVNMGLITILVVALIVEESRSFTASIRLRGCTLMSFPRLRVQKNHLVKSRRRVQKSQSWNWWNWWNPGLLS